MSVGGEWVGVVVEKSELIRVSVGGWKCVSVGDCGWE